MHGNSSTSLEQTKQLSLVIPVYNEIDNLRPFLTEVTSVLERCKLEYEIIFVDDGSSDGSDMLLREMSDRDHRVIVVRLRRNHGQTAAFAAGFDTARGDLVLTMDGDRQNDPADIPALLAKIDEGYDVINGWRQERQDGLFMRRIPSAVANWLITRLTKVPLHDRGCSLRLFRSEVVRELHLYGELHRFIPEMVNFAGFRMAEVPVNHRRRLVGQSKYGLSRTFRVILDLLTIIYLRNYSDRPMRLFGAVGIFLGGIGTALGAYLTGLKLWAGIQGGWQGFHEMRIGERPLLLLAVLLVIIGVQILVMGLIAEHIVRTYYEVQDKPIYHTREIIRHDT
jgi:glycosyltransferase involved in cell wall biosynthesis